MWAMVSRAGSMPSSVKSQGYVYMVARMGVVSLGRGYSFTVLAVSPRVKIFSLLGIDGIGKQRRNERGPFFLGTESRDICSKVKTTSMRRLALGVMVCSRKLSNLSQGEAVPPEDHS